MEFTDPYENTAIENLIYVTENIPIKETEELFNDIFSSGCKCNNLCLESVCTCIKSSINYKINPNIKSDQIKDILQTNYILNPEKLIIYECNTNCECNKIICGNKLVQYGPRNNLNIKNCENKKGFGLFTNTNILKGNFICEYAGEVITKTEAKKRFKHNEEKQIMNYVICVKEHFGGNSLQETIIDPTYFGNIGRFLNHSCDPNCELIPIRINNLIPKLCIFAKRDIEANSELTFDYGGDDGDCDLFDDKIKLKECLCGEEKCRKWMPYNKNILI